MKTYAYWSGGKDSTASIILCKENGIHLDGIVFCEVMYDHSRNISGENPLHIKWVNEVAIPLFESWGYEVIRLRSAKDYLACFHHRITKGERQGKKNGFFIPFACIGNRDLKMKPIHDFRAEIGEHTEIVGIAIDEPKRLQSLSQKPNKRSILAEFGYTEQMAKELCRKYGLLSPIYDYVGRGGCFFCPNQTIEEWALLRKTAPQLFDELKELSKDKELCSNKVTRQYTFADIDYKTAQLNNWVQQNIFDIMEKQ